MASNSNQIQSTIQNPRSNYSGSTARAQFFLSFFIPLPQNTVSGFRKHNSLSRNSKDIETPYIIYRSINDHNSFILYLNSQYACKIIHSVTYHYRNLFNLSMLPEKRRFNPSYSYSRVHSELSSLRQFIHPYKATCILHLPPIIALNYIAQKRSATQELN